MLESVLNSSTGNVVTTLSLTNSLMYAVVAALLGVVISLTYIKTGKVSKNFARTLIVLPVLVCVVMIAVNGNLGASVAVMGAFSLVRFRSLQGSSRDIAFIFFTMTVGIVCSIGSILLAVTITALVCLIWVVLSVVKYADTETTENELRVTIPEHLDYTEIFDDIFESYTSEHKLVRVKTTNMGSMYDLFYRVKLVDSKDQKKFIDEIRCRNGNLTVILGRVDMNPAEEL